MQIVEHELTHDERIKAIIRDRRSGKGKLNQMDLMVDYFQSCFSFVSQKTKIGGSRCLSVWY